MPGPRNDVSFIVNSTDDQKYRKFEEHLRVKIPLSDIELIRIPDAVSMAEGLNRGASLARGQFLIFCHDDIFILNKDILKIIEETFRSCEVFGACGATRLVSGNWYDVGKPFTFGHVVAKDLQKPGGFEIQVFGWSPEPLVMGGQALDGIFIGCRRRIFDALQGFDQISYTDFVGYDVDFSFRAALAGAKIGINCDLTLFHDSHVGEFSADKIRRWEQAQSGFLKRFGRYLSSECGERGHCTFSISSLAEATEVIMRERGKMSAPAKAKRAKGGMLRDWLGGRRP
jgi:GT2 family glycosyltransferase